MPWRVVAVELLEGFRAAVHFVDDLEGNADMAGLVQSPSVGVFAPRSDIFLFTKVFVEHAAVTWLGEIDLAPDVMHAEIPKT